MRKLSFIIVAAISCATLAQANVSVEIDAGVLRTASGTPLTSGMLQLIASRTGPSGTFAAPTASSFTGGDSSEIIVATFSFNQGSSGFVAGESDNIVTYNLENLGASSSAQFDSGDALLLRWYPTLSTSATSPGIGTTYGQYRSDVGEVGGISWFSPSDGSITRVPNSLNFLTMSAGGSNSDLSGRASFTVGVVPEPSTCLMWMVAIPFLALVHRTRVRSAFKSHRDFNVIV